MVDTPVTPAAKRGRPPKAKTLDTAASAVAVKTEPLKKAATEAASDAAAEVESTAKGLSAQIKPIKEQAEKAAKAAAEKLNAVDWKAHIDPIKEQAGKTAKSAAGVAKDKTGTAMQSLSKLIADTAATVDAKLGPQYGDYARQAAEQVAGAADSLDNKDVDQLMAEARDFVRKSPAVAIGAAAVVGFVLMRLAKGSDDKA